MHFLQRGKITLKYYALELLTQLNQIFDEEGEYFDSEFFLSHFDVKRFDKLFVFEDIENSFNGEAAFILILSAA